MTFQLGDKKYGISPKHDLAIKHRADFDSSESLEARVLLLGVIEKFVEPTRWYGAPEMIGPGVLWISHAWFWAFEGMLCVRQASANKTVCQISISSPEAFDKCVARLVEFGVAKL